MKIIEKDKYYGLYVKDLKNEWCWYIKGWTWRKLESALNYIESKDMKPYLKNREWFIFEIDLHKCKKIKQNDLQNNRSM